MNTIKLLLAVMISTLVVACGGGNSVPGAPTGVIVSAGSTVGTTASISFTAPASDGGSPITGYAVTATPGGITASGTASQIALTGLTAGTDYTFSVTALNSVGSSAPATAKNINTYNVVETFYEPMTQPNNSIFTGSFTFDSVSQTVSNLTGSLTESMTKVAGCTGKGCAFGTMTTVNLNNQLSAVYDATLGGVLVTAFALNTTDTFDLGGFAPGGTQYFGLTAGTPNNHNAYAMIFVNTADPTAALTQAQIDKLAYADCTAGGMMMTSCMTGTTVAGYGKVGTMKGYPVSQLISRVGAAAQTITFGAAPTIAVGGTGTVSATGGASGNAVIFTTKTTSVCTLSGNTVTGVANGICTIAADQAGNADYNAAAQATQNITIGAGAAAQTITFGAAPAITVGGTGTVTATGGASGNSVTFNSTTTSICTVASGLVKGLAAGTCTIAANQAGNASYAAAAQVTQDITVTAVVPGAPTGVSVAAGATPGTTASVSFTAPASNGGSAITGYTVTATPGGITATGTASPIALSGLTPQTAYTYSVVATNSVGNGAATATGALNFYSIVETFYEPMTQPNNSIFTGSFTYESATQTVSNLTGSLTQAMTMMGPMTTVPLTYQLSAVPDATLGGLLVTTFALNTTDTFDPAGFAPGGTQYFGLTAGTPNNHNAYAMIFVNTTDPAIALTQAQMDKLAYADCTAGGMMMSTCMTGTTVAGYGTVGTMKGYPSSQVVTKQ